MRLVFGLKGALLAGVALGCVSGNDAFAQTAPAATDDEGVGEIVVTARRVEESIQDTPLSVSVQTAESLEEHNVTDLYGLQTLTPALGVQVTSGQVGATRFTIRGIGTAVLGPQHEASVGLVVDDVAMGRGQLFPAGGLFDLERVEVLSGPQGMLFGKNAAAGLINIVTASPRIGETEAFANLQHSVRDTGLSGNISRVQLGGNLPVGDDAALRVAGYYSTQDEIVTNLLGGDNGHDEWGTRVQFRVQPTTAWDIRLSADYAEGDGLGEAGMTHRLSFPGSGAEANDMLGGVTASPENLEFASPGPLGYDSRTFGASLRTTWTVNDFDIINVTAYRESEYEIMIDPDLGPLPYNNQTQRGDFEQFSTEFRIVSPRDGFLTYQAGVYYLDLRAEEEDVFNSALFGYLGNLNYGIENTSFAAFAEGEWHLSDALTLTTGVRYTQDEIDFSERGVENIPLFLPPAIDNSASADNVSGRVILDYAVNPNTMVYASWSRGYKGPAFDQFTGNVVVPEIPTNIEIGLRSTLFDNTLRFNVSVYDEEFENFQTQVLDPLTFSVLAVNAGSLQARGVDLNAEWRPISPLTISLGVLYNQTEYKDLDNLPCYYGQPMGPAPDQCNGFAPITGTTSASGNQLAQAPEWTETLGVRFEQPVWSGWSGFVQADGYFRSSFNFTPYENPYAEIDATSIFNLALGVTSDDGRITFQVFGHNLTDERVPGYILQDLSSVFTGDAFTGQGAYTQHFNEESFRSFGVSLNYRM